MNCPFCDDGACQGCLSEDLEHCEVEGDCRVCCGTGHIGIGLLVEIVETMSDPDREQLFDELRNRWYMKTGAPRREPLIQRRRPASNG